MNVYMNVTKWRKSYSAYIHIFSPELESQHHSYYPEESAQNACFRSVLPHEEVLDSPTKWST